VIKSLITNLLLITSLISAQAIRWQESFETDGEGTRYTTSSFFTQAQIFIVNAQMGLILAMKMGLTAILMELTFGQQKILMQVVMV